MCRTYICLTITAFLLMIAGAAFGGDGGARMLGPGDRVRVVVLNEPDVTRETVIDGSGAISLGLVGDTKVAGMTPAQAALAIQRSLKEYILKPQVSVELLEPGKVRVFVVGEVKKPGMYMLNPGARLLEALTTAEYTENSDLSRISVQRSSQVLNIDLNPFMSGKSLDSNIAMQPEDTVVVARQETPHAVLVLGEVNHSGPVSVTPGMTFREVVAAAGGVTPNADTARITIKHSGKQDVQLVRFDQALAGDAAADVAVSSGDTVYVPKAEDSYFIIQGGVNQPGKYPLKGSMTIEDAAAAAGGFSKDAKVESIQVVHSTPGGLRSQKVNLKDVRDGKAPVVVLQPKDTVVVATKRDSSRLLGALTGIATLVYIFRP